jgi:SAM-dependent methyltransferase
MGDRVIADQIAYYRARAPRYDDAYSRTGQHDRGPAANAAWRREMAGLVAAFDRVPLGPEVLELAAGTGKWTSRIARRASTVTVVDAAPEALLINRRRLGPDAGGVHYLAAEIFHWSPRRTWDSCAFFFWLNHVPDARLAQFLTTVSDSLRPGGTVVFGDEAYRPDLGDEGCVRRLDDGRQFSIVKCVRPPGVVERSCALAGLEIHIQAIGRRFYLAVGQRPIS